MTTMSSVIWVDWKDKLPTCASALVILLPAMSTRAVGSAPTKGRRSKRGGGNRANAQGASKRAKQKMDDAADCLQLLSEGFA